MKILIVYAQAGMGHKKSAEALVEGFREIDKNGTDVFLIDALDYTNRIFRWIYSNTYSFMVKRLPNTWGFFYYILGKDWLYPLISKIRRIMNGLNSKEFVELIKKEKPDSVVSTHFLPSEIVSDLKKRKKFRGRLITVITDFSLHSFWVTPCVDIFVVSSENVKRDLLKKGIKESNIEILGIPISLDFCDRISRG